MWRLPLHRHHNCYHALRMLQCNPPGASPSHHVMKPPSFIRPITTTSIITPFTPSNLNTTGRTFTSTSTVYQRSVQGIPMTAGNRDLNTTTTSQEVDGNDIERIPVPAGIPTDRMGLYDINDSHRGLGELPGVDSLFVVHGPSEVWAPKGLVKGHGAGGGTFAVFQKSGGFQFKVMKNDVFYTDRIKGDVNSQVYFDDVLLIGTVDWSWFGRPCIRNARVVTTIEEQTKSGKIYVTKFKKRTGYSRRQGHRQLITRFRVDDIVYDSPDASRFVDHVPLFDPKDTPRNLRFHV